MSEVPAGCAPFESDLSALIDGELSESRAAQVRAHLAECERCTERMAALRRVDATLRSLPIPTVAPELADRTRRAVSQARPGRARSATEGRSEAEPSEAQPGGEPREVHVETRSDARRAPPRRRQRWIPPAIAALAAALALALVLGRMAERSPRTIAPRVAESTPEAPGAPGSGLEAVPETGPEAIPEELRVLVEAPAPQDLEGVSDAEIELALAADALGGVEPAAVLLEDWELIEQLDWLERLESLESREHG